MLGHKPDTPTPSQLDPTTDPLTAAAFGASDPIVDPAVSAATGVGEANSACCRAKCSAFDSAGACVERSGPFCNRNAGGVAMSAVENQDLAGCAESTTGDCVGGAATSSGASGCVVIAGQILVDGEPASEEECTNAAVDACVAGGGAL
jgi:hypothetical protein